MLSPTGGCAWSVPDELARASRRDTRRGRRECQLPDVGVWRTTTVAVEIVMASTADRLCFRAQPEVIAPSHHQRVEFPYLFGRFLLQGFPASPLTDPLNDSLHLLLARSCSNVDFPALGRITPPKTVAQELKALLWYSAQPRLVFIDFQSQLFHHPLHLRVYLLPLVHTKDYEVVRVVDYPGVELLLVSKFFPSQHESSHVEIGNRGEIGAPCGVPLRWRRAGLLRLFPPLPSLSSTGICSHFLSNFNIAPSLMRRARLFIN